jgi:flagellar biosynthesis protein FlhF
MKIIRHTARDMRQAMRAVREQLGDDAVILSSRRTSEGVEVTAAVDFDASTLEAGGFANAPVVSPVIDQPPQGVECRAVHLPDPNDSIPAAVREAVAAQNSPVAQAAVRAKPVAAHRAPAVPTVVATVEPAAASLPQTLAASFAPSLARACPEPALRYTPTDVPASFSEPLSLNTAVPANASVPLNASATEAMSSELKTLRRMLETQLAHLAWNDLTRRAPVRAEILRELTEIGITPDLAQHLVRQLPEDTDLTFARRFTVAGLSQYLRVTGDRWLDEGGRVAFAGATGVGKTTTLAKVAARWVLRHGARDIALVAADSVRIGAQDQLQSLAQLLGVPVYAPDCFDGLPDLLASLKQRLILIDTPGSSARDVHLGKRLAVLSDPRSQLETALVLSASTQAGAVEEAVQRFWPANPTCCVMTKLDEAASLGGVLSILIRAKLPVAYVSEGQRVPEDLRPARALELVSAAVHLAKASGAAADEDLLRRRYGKSGHGIA